MDDQFFQEAVEQVKEMLIEGDSVLDTNFIESIIDLVVNQTSPEYQMTNDDLVYTLQVYIQAYINLTE